MGEFDLNETFKKGKIPSARRLPILLYALYNKIMIKAIIFLNFNYALIINRLPFSGSARLSVYR